MLLHPNTILFIIGLEHCPIDKIFWNSSDSTQFSTSPTQTSKEFWIGNLIFLISSSHFFKLSITAMFSELVIFCCNKYLSSIKAINLFVCSCFNLSKPTSCLKSSSTLTNSLISFSLSGQAKISSAVWVKVHSLNILIVKLLIIIIVGINEVWFEFSLP